MKYSLLFIISTLILSLAGRGQTTPATTLDQSYSDRFESLFKSKDTLKLKALLDHWEKADPNDPELYTSAINFYFYTARQETISLDKNAERLGLQITDNTGKTVAYLNTAEHYRPDQLGLAFEYIDKGIRKFPNRLDMRFGKCYALGKINDYDHFTAEIIATVEYSRSNDNKWLWTRNKTLDSGKNFMLQTIQNYLKQLYNTENDSLLKNMQQIGDLVIRYYPDNVEILSTTAVAYMLLKNYDPAIGYLHMAEKINPTDFIVLNNLAQGYKLKGDKANAIKYYQLSEKFGDERAKHQAQENIKALTSP